MTGYMVYRASETRLVTPLQYAFSVAAMGLDKVAWERVMTVKAPWMNSVRVKRQMQVLGSRPHHNSSHTLPSLSIIISLSCIFTSSSPVSPYSPSLPALISYPNETRNNARPPCCRPHACCRCSPLLCNSRSVLIFPVALAKPLVIRDNQLVCDTNAPVGDVLAACPDAAQFGPLLAAFAADPEAYTYK